MKKTNLVKIFLVILVSLMLVLTTTSTFATEDFVDGNFTELERNKTNTGGGSIAADTNTNTNTGNSNTNNNNTNANTNNSSNYNTNNANLPKTGIAETGSVVFIIFALGLSAVYAYKKLEEYNV